MHATTPARPGAAQECLHEQTETDDPAPPVRRRTMRAHPSPAWISLAPRPSSVSDGRRFARTKLTAYETEFADDVVLVTSEMVTNSVRAIEASGCAAQEVIRLGVGCTKQWVHLCVQDTCPRLPARRQAALTDENGRGLQIVETYALWWLTEYDSYKTMHALMPTSGMVLTLSDLNRLARDL